MNTSYLENSVISLQTEVLEGTAPETISVMLLSKPLNPRLLQAGGIFSLISELQDALGEKYQLNLSIMCTFRL